MQTQVASRVLDRIPQQQASIQNLDEYLPGIVERDERAFARWMAGAEQKLRASLRSFAATVDTEAVLQETLVRTWQKAPGVVCDGKPNTLLRYSLRIAKNLAISEVRRRRCVPVGTDDMERRLDLLSTGQSQRPSDPMLRSVIQHCREQLPPKPKKALDLRLSSRGESDASLAARAGMTKNTFLQNYTRARKLLAKHLAGSGVNLEMEMA